MKGSSTKNTIVLGVFYFFGLVHWYLFLNYQSPGFYHEDWPLYHQMYAVYQTAIEKGELPYYASLFAGESLEHVEYDTSMFLANPWKMFSPHLLLLKFISVPAYITFQYMLFFTIMFIGMLKWARKFNLSLWATLFLMILYSYNGKLLALSGFGHIQAASGYMLMPWFFWVMHRWVEEQDRFRRKRTRNILGLSLFLFIVLSQDMHVYYQMALAGGCAMLFYPKKILYYILSVVLSAFYSLWYVLPILMFNPRTTGSYGAEGHWREFGTYGYGAYHGHDVAPIFSNIREMPIFEAVPKFTINVISHIWQMLTQPQNVNSTNSQEYSLYVSYIGIALIIGSLIALIVKYKPFAKRNIMQYRYLFGMCIVMLLAIGPTNQIIIQLIYKLHPINPIDAIPSRLMFIPFCLAVLLAAIGFDECFRVVPEKIRNMTKGFSLLALLTALMYHSYFWWLFNAQTLSAGKWPFRGFKAVIYDVNNPLYKSVVNYSYLGSIFLVIIASVIYFRLAPLGNREARLIEAGA